MLVAVASCRKIQSEMYSSTNFMPIRLFGVAKPVYLLVIVGSFDFLVSLDFPVSRLVVVDLKAETKVGSNFAGLNDEEYNGKRFGRDKVLGF